jgi:sortase A
MVRAFRRHLGTILITVGAVLIVYALAVVFWRDPVTDAINSYRQHQLQAPLAAVNREYARIVATEDDPPATVTIPVSETLRDAHRVASQFAAEYGKKIGDPIGKIHIGRMGITAIVVQGTDSDSLTKGPGHYETTEFPGQGRTIGIAGHRTTYGAWFRHIDDLKTGDQITLRMPYGTFAYAVTSHKIVKNNDWSIIKDVGYEQLMLSACHPLFTATHRYVVFARLIRVQLIGRHSVTLPT